MFNEPEVCLETAHRESEPRPSQCRATSASHAVRLAKIGAEKAALPNFIEPCHPTLKKQPPDGPNWLHEIKFATTTAARSLFIREPD